MTFVYLSFCTLSFSVLWGPLQGAPFHAKAEADPYINAATALLATCAIFGGIFFQAIFIQFDPIAFLLPPLHKGLTMFVVLSGLLLAGFLWDIDFQGKVPNKASFFFNTIWLLAPLSAQPLTKFSMLLGTKAIKSVDQGWLEIAGGQGTLNLVTTRRARLQKLQASLFTFFIVIILIAVILLFFSASA